MRGIPLSLGEKFRNWCGKRTANKNSHHIILPGLGVTPEAGRYVAEFFSVSGLKQGEFAGKLREHVESLVGDTMPIFFHAAPSRENAEVVVAVSGWKSGVNAGAYMAVSAEYSSE
jgi:hypothetical protein